MSSRRAAAEKPPVSTTRVNTVRLVIRSIVRSDYPSWRDNPFTFDLIIKPDVRPHSARQSQQVVFEGVQGHVGSSVLAIGSVRNPTRFRPDACGAEARSLRSRVARIDRCRGAGRTSLLDGRPVPGIDRRRVRESGLHDDRAEGVGLHRRSAGERQRHRRGRPAAGAHRRPRLPHRAGRGAR